MNTQNYIAALAGLTLAIGAALADEAPVTSAANTATPAVPAPVRRAATREPHWAYQAVRHQEVPTVAKKDWVLTPVDAFVLAKLEASKLAPSPDADREIGRAHV